MQSKVRRLAVVAGSLALAFAGAAAAAAEPTGPHVTDPCGDVNEMVSVNGTRIDNPDEEHVAGFDIEAAWFEDILDDDGRSAGVTIHSQTCDEVPEPELPDAYWMVSWQLDQECGMRVSARDVVGGLGSSPVQRTAVLQAWCDDSGSGSRVTEWTEAIPSGAFVVEGDRMSWTLTPDLLPPERSGFLASGTLWHTPYVVSRDDRFVMMGAGGGTNGPWWRMMAAGALDFAGGRPYTVGEQAEQVTP